MWPRHLPRPDPGSPGQRLMPGRPLATSTLSNTAVRWGKYAKRDWAAYVAKRVDDTSIKAGAWNRAAQE